MSERAERFHTHRVDNQPPPLVDYNAFDTDLPLREALQRAVAGRDLSSLSQYGAAVGGELLQLGFEANRHRPQLRTHDRYGHRVDEVDFHPAYHRLMQAAIAAGVHTCSWADDQPGAHVLRGTLSYLHHQAEAGTSCPLTMTHAAVPVLQKSSALGDWLPLLLSRDYDARALPAGQKRGLTLGMGMTEKQGGSDVRTNTSEAHPVGGLEYELVGHKWFFSAPMSDGFLVLAQAPGGLSCFLLPRWRPDGSRNALHLMRLKDKVGNWSNASSEVEFKGAWASRVGDEGRGVATIIEMVALTRLDCMLGSAAEMRRALVEALHHALHRRAFGARLIEQPLMREVLADLALESEAATALAIRVAAAVDASARDATEAAFARIATAIGKFWICKRAPGFVNEAQECLGGAGYVEESILARLYREAPLNSIWEGCGNVQCLDVLRALQREPHSVAALFDEFATATGIDAGFDGEVTALRDAVRDADEANARRLVERLALALQAAVLLRGSEHAIGAAFCRARLGGGGRAYGSMPPGMPVARLLARAWPAAG
jgi:putative acyl-CoA dehydrogenase